MFIGEPGIVVISFEELGISLVKFILEAPLILYSIGEYVYPLSQIVKSFSELFNLTIYGYILYGEQIFICFRKV